MKTEKYLISKQQQFNTAMELYNNKYAYRWFGIFIAFTNCSLQVLLLLFALRHSIGFAWQLISMVCAYLVTDFINGLVHLYMDHNDNYALPTGPLVAAFHLHHKTPRYKKRNLLLVYFYETGSKVWLVGYLSLALVLTILMDIPPVLAYLLAYTGILSSWAEVSHYLCHIDDSKLAQLLRKTGLILSKKHHGQHHIEDNKNYTFLNGMSDFLLNVIARYFYPGYKTTTDLHYQAYTGPQTENR